MRIRPRWARQQGEKVARRGVGREAAGRADYALTQEPSLPGEVRALIALARIRANRIELVKTAGVPRFY